MGELNPVDPQFEKVIAGQGKQVRNLGVATQPQLINWLDYNVADFTYALDGVITTTSIDALSTFAIGDKVRLTQGGSTKYFYVTGIMLVSGTYHMALNAGDDFTYDNTALTAIAFSKLSTPEGHPVVFTTAATITDNGGTPITGWITQSLTFSYTGSIWQGWINIDTASLPSGKFVLRIVTSIDYPILGVDGSFISRLEQPLGSFIDVRTRLSPGENGNFPFSSFHIIDQKVSGNFASGDLKHVFSISGGFSN